MLSLRIWDFNEHSLKACLGVGSSDQEMTREELGFSQAVDV